MGNGIGLRFKKVYTSVYEFLTEKGIETHEESTASRLHRFAHFWLLVFKSFARNRCPLRATALAYTTLLALVPMLAVGVSITSSLLKEKGVEATRQLIEEFVDAAVPQLKLMPKNPDASKLDSRTEVITRIEEFISNIQSKTLGITGIIGLVTVAILLLSTIEDTFNDIWGVTQGRSWFKRIVQYWTTISLGPVVLAAIVVMVSSTLVQSGRDSLSTLPFLGKLILPFIIVSCAFSLFYKIIPNTQVDWTAALVAGGVGGSLWLLLNIFNAFNLSRVVSMSAIYGSVMGIIPIFLIGLYFSWLILLFGAQVAYAYQNRVVYLQEKKAESVNQRGREYVALRVMTFLAQRFAKGEQPPALLEIATQLGVPSRLVGRVLHPLMEARLIIAVSGNETAYAPARPLETITCHDVLQTMRVGSGQELLTRDEPTRPFVCAEFEKIQAAERQVAAAVSLRDLIDQIPGAQPEA